MRRIPHLLQTTLVLLALVAVCASGCRTGEGIDGSGAAWTKAQAELLRQAGERLGVPVRTDGMVQFAQSGAVLYTAPAANLERIPATELPRGVNVAVAYVDSPGQSVPKGFYTLRAVADAKQVGRVEGKVQLVDSRGGVAAELPATVDVQSLSVPTLRPGDQTIISIFNERLVGHCNSNYEYCYCCPNGWIVCVRRLILINPAVATAP